MGLLQKRIAEDAAVLCPPCSLWRVCRRRDEIDDDGERADGLHHPHRHLDRPTPPISASMRATVLMSNSADACVRHLAGGRRQELPHQGPEGGGALHWDPGRRYQV